MYRVAGFVCLLLSLCNCTGMDAALKAYGYIPLTPPSKLLKPGAMIFKKKRRGTFEVGIICTPEQSLGWKFTPLESDTIPTMLENNVNKSFDLDADAIDKLTGGVGSKHTKKVSIKLQNAKLIEINDWIVATYIGDRSEACTRMIKQRQAAGYEVTMVTSALVADAAYNVEWADDGRINAEAKMQTEMALSAKLSGRSENSHKNHFEADEMVWGVRTDNFLAAMSLAD